jgi:hypothetical protein
MANQNWSGGDASPWTLAVEEVAIATFAAKCENEARHLTMLDALLREAPCQRLVTGLQPAPQRILTAQLDAGAGAAIALGMLGSECGYMLSRGASGLHIASVALPNSREEVSASGSSAGLALVGAIALAIVEREHDRLKGRAQIDTLG